MCFNVKLKCWNLLLYKETIIFKFFIKFIGIILGLQILTQMLPSIIKLLGKLISYLASLVGMLIKFVIDILVMLVSYIFDILILLFKGFGHLLYDFFTMIFNFKYAAPLMLYPVRLLLALISVLGIITIFSKIKTNYLRVPLMIIAFIWLVNILNPNDVFSSTFIVKYLWQLIGGFVLIYKLPDIVKRVNKS